jgi:hypothetical protein
MLTPESIISWRRRSFGAVVAAGHLDLRGIDGGDAPTKRTGDLNEIGQIIFTLGIGVADALEKIERLAAVDRHQPAVAPSDGALGVGRVLFLTNGDEFTVLDEQAPIAGRTVGMEADDDDITTIGKTLASSLQRSIGLERHVAIGDEDVVIALGDRITRREHRMAGAETLLLQIGFNPDAADIGRLRHIFGITADDECDGGDAGGGHRLDHMGDHRPSGDRVQHLRFRRFHPRAVTGGKNDGKTSAFHDLLRESPP